MNGGVAEEKQVIMRSALSHAVKSNGYSENGRKGKTPTRPLAESTRTHEQNACMTAGIAKGETREK